MRTEDIKRQNEKYYYCEDYIWSIKKVSMFISMVCAFSMFILSWRINRLLLKKQFLTAAATIELGTEDVMHWVNSRMADSRLDIVTIGIFLFNLIIITLILSRLWLKSYDLYKNTWIRKLLLLLYLVELVWIGIYYLPVNPMPELIVLCIGLAPAIFSSRLLYPLESRPGEDQYYKVLSFIFDILAKYIIDKM